MPQSFSAVHVHVVFSTLGRQPFLSEPEFRHEMHRILGSLSGRLGCPTVLVGGVEDHVHLLARLGREVSQSAWVKEIKRQSTTSAKERQPAFRWQSGFGAFSVGLAEIATVRRYIERQEEHHRVSSFQDELLSLLREHGIEYDERFLLQ
jgi:REP element-mobilizing transposase RayT